jgi:sugar (pentulose or hexulose) kinase
MAATSFARPSPLTPALAMTGPYLVGIDCGTQSAKVVIYDDAGTALARGQQTLRPMDRPRNGVVLHPNDDLWDSIAAASRQAFDNFTGDRGEIVGVGLCPIRCCKAFLKADGSLVEPVMSWMDERAYQPYLPDDPSLAYATTLSGYLTYRFTGERRDTAANNILQWPIDTDTWAWSDDPAQYEAFNVRPEMLFELVMPGEILGRVTAAAADATGIPVGTPVVATANDKAVEMLGSGSIGEHTALISLGTYIAGMVHGHKNHGSPANFWTNFACLPHRYLYESSGVRRGMWTLTWFLDLLGPEFADRATSLGVSRETYIEPEAAAVPPGSDGLLTVLDWLAPTDKPYRKGSIVGFDARHGRGHLYRSILEAIALTMKHHVDAMCGELGIALHDVLISGGGANSPLFMQIFADVFGLPAARNIDGGGAALGAAICAAAATGVHPDLATAAAAMAPTRESFAPDRVSNSLYGRLSGSLYDDLRAATDPLYERIFPTFH